MYSMKILIFIKFNYLFSSVFQEIKGNHYKKNLSLKVQAVDFLQSVCILTDHR